MFTLAGWSIEDLLEQVASFSDTKLAQCLWHDWYAGHAPGREGIWMTAFWEGHEKAVAFDFYTSRKLYDRMEALALADDTDAELAARASAVAGIIEAKAAWSIQPSWS